ncbi:MAG: amino acid adenylation domain-containing protein [Nodularia sp. CChRGM 3473]
MSTYLHSNDLLSQKIYWINKLSGEIPETNLMLDYVRPLFSSEKNKSLSFDLPNDLSQRIIKLAKGSYFSTYWILVSVLNILLQKYTQNNDVIVGIPIYEGTGTGYLNSKIMPLRTRVTPQLSFKDFLFQVKDAIIGVYNNQNYNFDELIQLLELPKSPNRCPIFDIVVLLENIHSKKNLNQLNNDITISFAVNGEGISANIEYSEYLFQDENIKLIAKYYSNILEYIITNIDTKISNITFLKDAERYQLLQEYNNNIKEYPVEHTINKLFENQVFQTSNNVAVIYKEARLTYQELNCKANQMAELLRNLGVRKGEFVGILKDRDIDFIIGILAIHKASAVYVPVDSSYPTDRIKYMVSNSEAKILLTDSSCLDILAGLQKDCPHLECLICSNIISDKQAIAATYGVNIYDELDFCNLSRENVEADNQGIDPAYMIYTSGSTGLPKGVIIRHGSAINHIYAEFDALELTEDFTFLQTAPASSDISVWQFLAPILIGGKTVIVDAETVCNPEKLFKVIKEEKITIVELVPVVFSGLLDYISRLSIDERLLTDLKWMMVTGESVSVELINKWLRIYPSIKVVNAYGPSEAADDITQFIVARPLPKNQRTVPIGKPLANLNVCILDAQMQLLPMGFPGEICVSGFGVAEGYWKNEEMTKLSFVPNPFSTNAKSLPGIDKDLIYKTGDLGRWLPNGNIEFLGRIDRQVKIRGFRIELGEIEALISQHQAVKEAVVVVREKNPDDKCLVAYVVFSPEFHQHDPSSSEIVQQLRNALKGKLPEYMVPSAILPLEALPLTPSGKVDRRALPIPNFHNESKVSFVAPRTPEEEIVVDIWMQILKREHIGIYDNFFDLGGHSLLATQVISRLREAFKVELPLRSLFEAPTVAQLVEHIEKMLTVQQLQLMSMDALDQDREEIEL